MRKPRDLSVESVYYAIGENIRMARLKQRLSQQDVGDRIGLTHTVVSRIERGVSRADLDCLVKIADAVGLELIDLISDEVLRGR